MHTLARFAMFAVLAGAACVQTPEGEYKAEEVGEAQDPITFCQTHDNLRYFFNEFNIPTQDFNYDDHAEMEAGPINGYMFFYVFDPDDNLVDLNNWTITPIEE